MEWFLARRALPELALAKEMAQVSMLDEPAAPEEPILLLVIGGSK
jgi:hypothetical protein